jgi:hypothetical protein
MSPGPKVTKEVRFNQDIFTPWAGDQEDIELQKTLAMSLQEAHQPKTRSPRRTDRRMEGDTLITNENLFNVPAD